MSSVKDASTSFNYAPSGGPPRMNGHVLVATKRQRKHNDNYKTEYCAHAKHQGCCVYGAKCQFAHFETERRARPVRMRYKTEPCARWHSRIMEYLPPDSENEKGAIVMRAQGACPYKEACEFLHDEYLVPVKHNELWFVSAATNSISREIITTDARRLIVLNALKSQSAMDTRLAVMYAHLCPFPNGLFAPHGYTGPFDALRIIQALKKQPHTD